MVEDKFGLNSIWKTRFKLLAFLVFVMGWASRRNFEDSFNDIEILI